MYTFDEFKDDFVNLFKSKKQKEEDRKKLEQFKGNEDRLIQYLENMDKEYRKNNVDRPTEFERYISPTLGLKKKDYKEIDKAELDDIASAKIDAMYGTDRGAIEQRHSDKVGSIKEDIKDEEAKTKRDLVHLKDRLKDRLHDIDDKAVRNGMLKSSIKDMEIDSVIARNDEDSDRLKDDLDSKRNKAKSDIDNLVKMRDIALKDLDLAKANEYDKTIRQLEKAITKENNDIKAYNNKVDVKEKEYAVHRKDIIEKLKSEEARRKRSEANFEKYHDYRGAKKDEYEERYLLAAEVFNAMPRKLALERIKNNPKLEALLGKYYDRLLSNQAAR